MGKRIGKGQEIKKEDRKEDEKEYDWYVSN